MPAPSLELDPATLAELGRFGFDPVQLETFAARVMAPVAAGGADPNLVRGAITPLVEGDVRQLPAAGSAEATRLAALGRDAARRGEVGVVVLAGGMATRFGGVVKAIVPAIGPHSFLALKHADVAARAREAGAVIPMLLMTSYATHDRTLAHVAELGLGGPAPVASFPQFVSVRLGPGGGLFRQADGTLSPYSTGHGDLTFALRASGTLDRFRRAGGRVLCVSNVDNLGATLDWTVLGAHLEHGRAVTAELVAKAPGDRGGAPARVDGVPQIIEAFRFPPAFDQDSIPLFNTNSFVLDASALDRDFPLDFFQVEKQVDGRAAIQFERLVGQLTAHLPTQFLVVPRDGVDGRFQPVKDPAELTARRPVIEALLAARGVATS
ncbi:MAG: UTP--glucose-1-phosphate uridylyltransferase [Kofleriaceae bacterium]|nr:UTP--glucose-1-phosphate uridylyltransferase [Kofleriaceae bacterium]MBP6839728.1 UTP--glucose-1-phosphate uridylyltransferase [Kofleriaceae bacterium]MBP9206680.1 UTP--glucose-1-phosphate uridylyltransferase [Kofleriaceae bacterium]